MELRAADISPALEARDLYRFFHAGDDETFALRGVSISLRAGEMVAVVGPSGSGKSTLLACLAGLDEPDGGHVVVGGERITRRAESVRGRIRARSMGILLQSGNLLDHLTVARNVALAQSLSGASAIRGPLAILADVGLERRAGARPATLSGGEAARAGLAVALANDPPVLLADEPTGEVDRGNERMLLDLLRGRIEQGGAVLVVTHSERVAAEANRVVRLADGKVLDD